MNSNPALFGLALRAIWLAAVLGATAAPVSAAELASVPVQAGTSAAAQGYDGVVEAVRQTVVAAQVAGAVVELKVKVGDRVAAGQVLVRIDARAALQSAAAGDAQVLAARAALEVATQDYRRQQQLQQQGFISAAALERAEASLKSARAQFDAQQAQAGVAHTVGGQHVLRAPFAGIVAEVPVELGTMALPGLPLLTLYDPAALRVTAAVPQTVARGIPAGAVPRVELPGLDAVWVTPLRVQQWPTVDAATLSVQFRAELPPGLAGVVPGMFARLWLPAAAAAGPMGATSAAPAVLSVPLQAVVRRAELTAVYVLDAAGKPVLRQVRLGRVLGEQVEVLSGLMAGERVATTPQAAARMR